MKKFNGRDRKHKTTELSKLYVSYQGKLCEVDNKEGITINHVHNCVKWDWEGNIYFGFDPKYVTIAGW